MYLNKSDTDTVYINYDYMDLVNTVGCTLLLYYTYDKNIIITNDTTNLLVFKWLALNEYRYVNKLNSWSGESMSIYR